MEGTGTAFDTDLGMMGMHWSHSAAGSLVYRSQLKPCKTLSSSAFSLDAAMGTEAHWQTQANDVEFKKPSNFKRSRKVAHSINLPRKFSFTGKQRLVLDLHDVHISRQHSVLTSSAPFARPCNHAISNAVRSRFLCVVHCFPDADGASTHLLVLVFPHDLKVFGANSCCTVNHAA